MRVSMPDVSVRKEGEIKMQTAFKKEQNKQKKVGLRRQSHIFFSFTENFLRSAMLSEQPEACIGSPASTTTDAHKHKHTQGNTSSKALLVERRIFLVFSSS